MASDCHLSKFESLFYHKAQNTELEVATLISLRQDTIQVIQSSRTLGSKSKRKKEDEGPKWIYMLVDVCCSMSDTVLQD